MRLVVGAVLMLFAGAMVGAVAAPRLTARSEWPSPMPTARTLRSIDPTRIVVSLETASGDAAALQRLQRALPAAWASATRGRSILTLTGSTALPDVYVFLLDPLSNDARGYSIAPAGTQIRLVEVLPREPGNDDETVLIVMHELGHTLGCCRGAGTNGSHWLTCDRAAELMCQGSTASTFSDRELMQLGLGH